MILTHVSRLMGAGRVKVCKKRRILAGVRLNMVLDNYRAKLV